MPRWSDSAATRAGLHPSSVWPDWHEAGVDLDDIVAALTARMERLERQIRERPTLVRGLYDRNTAAEYLSCSPQLIDKLIRDGHLKATVPFGMTRGRRVTHEALLAYIAGGER